MYKAYLSNSNSPNDVLLHTVFMHFYIRQTHFNAYWPPVNMSHL